MRRTAATWRGGTGRRMRVIICGAGQVGWQIARHLATENNDVTVVDNNPDLVRRATDTLDVQGIHGHASYPEVLDRAGADDTDMIIAATHSDEVNMVTCQIAHSVFGVTTKIARLRAESYRRAIYSDLYRRDHMPIDVVISPEFEVADAALRRLDTPAAFDTENFLGDRVKLLGLHLDEGCPVLSTPLRQLSELFSTLRAIVIGVRREGTLFAPEPGDQLFPGDSIYVMCQKDDVARTLEVFGKASRRTERVVIVGAGSVGLAVARALEARGGKARARLIERDRTVAEAAADVLERIIVLNGDGLDSELQAEAGVDRADAILCVTDDDKTNMLAAVRAKHAGCPLAIALVNDPSLGTLVDPLGIDAWIDPRATTVSSILRHVRQGQIRSVYSIGEAEAELIEARVMKTSGLAGRRVADIEFPEGALLGMVQRGDEVFRPSGNFRVEVGDVVTIFTLASDVAEVQALLQVAVDFF